MSKDTKVKLTVTPQKRIGALKANFKKYTAYRNENIDFIMQEDKVDSWIVRLRDFSGNKDEFLGGEYLLEVKAPANYPWGPPEFYFLTPNGIYNCNKKVCISIGEYHADQYPATIGMGGFTIQLLNGMIAWTELGGGIEILHTSIAEKKALAAKSQAWNATHYPELVAQCKSLPFNMAYDKLRAKKYSYNTMRRICRYRGIEQPTS